MPRSSMAPLSQLADPGALLDRLVHHLLVDAGELAAGIDDVLDGVVGGTADQVPARAAQLHLSAGAPSP